MSDKDDVPRYRVRIKGQEPVAPRTRMWRPQSGGRYKGHSSVLFHAVPIRAVDFSGLSLDDFEAEGTHFTKCDFSGARIEGTFGLRRQTVFEDCSFGRARLGHVLPGQARFVRCDFVDLGDLGWSADATEFIDCRFSGFLRGQKFWGRPPGPWQERGALRPPRVTNEFRGNDFSAADLEDVAFVAGIDLDLQVLPSGPQYVRLSHIRERFAMARPKIATWEPMEARDEGLILLGSYSDAHLGFADQDDLFANRWETEAPRDIADRFWSLLESVLDLD